jgi:AraC-like DNA-binding protein
VSTLAGEIPLQYQAALGAVDTALSEGKTIAYGSKASSQGTALGRLRRDLVRWAEEKPEALPARYDHFIEAVALRSTLEAARVQLDVAFESMLEPLLKRGTLGAKDVEALSQALLRASGQAMTPSELFAVHRRAALDIVDAIARPDRARHDRSLRRAQEYLLEHYTERISLKQIAHIAGFAPTYFSELFHEKVGQTFADYVRHLRLERAKHLLSTTAFDLQRIAELSGLSTRQYLIRAFKRWVGSTPAQYRKGSRDDPTQDLKLVSSKSEGRSLRSSGR